MAAYLLGWKFPNQINTFCAFIDNFQHPINLTNQNSFGQIFFFPFLIFLSLFEFFKGIPDFLKLCRNHSFFKTFKQFFFITVVQKVYCVHQTTILTDFRFYRSLLDFTLSQRSLLWSPMVPLLLRKKKLPVWRFISRPVINTVLTAAKSAKAIFWCQKIGQRISCKMFLNLVQCLKMFRLFRVINFLKIRF